MASIDWQEFIKRASSDELRVETAMQHLRDVSDEIDPEATACSSIAVNLLTDGLWETVNSLMRAAVEHDVPLFVSKRAILTALYVVLRVLTERFGASVAESIEAAEFAARLAASVEKMLGKADGSVGITPLGKGTLGLTIPSKES